MPNQIKNLVVLRNLSSNLFMNQTYLMYFNNASKLTVLDLSNNNFIGSLPDFSIFPEILQELYVLDLKNIYSLYQINEIVMIPNICMLLSPIEIKSKYEVCS